MLNIRLLTRLPKAAAFLTLGLLAHPADAQTPAFGFTPNAYGVTDNAADTFGTPGSTGGSGVSSYSLGFEFTANSPEFVTSLGYFNAPSFDPNNPFGTVSLSPEPSGTYSYASSHQVGLYQVIPGTAVTAESGLLLGQTTITSAGTAGGDFLYNAIVPVALIPGTQYVIAGVSGSQDPYIYNIEDDSQVLGGQGDIVDPAITYNQSRYTVSDTLAYAGSTDGSIPGFFGPNLLLTPNAPVPEASTTVSLGLLLALGLAGMTFTARCRSRSL